MGFLGQLFLFGGYTLIYAAVAGGGKFATDPWNGILADAYTGEVVGGGSVTVNPTTNQATVTPGPKAIRPRTTGL